MFCSVLIKHGMVGFAGKKSKCSSSFREVEEGGCLMTSWLNNCCTDAHAPDHRENTLAGLPFLLHIPKMLLAPGAPLAESLAWSCWD